MSSLNQWQIIGNLGRDVELRYNADGLAMARGSLAVNERVKQPDGTYADRTLWVGFFAYGKDAETLAKYGTKGKSLWMQGPASLNQWEDDKGTARADLQIRVRQFVLLGGGEKNGNGGEWASAKPAPKPAQDEEDDGWA